MTEPSLRILQVTATSVGGSWFRDQVIGLARLGHTVQTVVPAAGPLSEQLRAAGVGVAIIPFRGRQVHQLPRVLAAEGRLVR
ncbi:MAG TPA: hypothetical protein VIV12_02960, partial [Streptosporangiaceae bacterium]